MDTKNLPVTSEQPATCEKASKSAKHLKRFVTVSVTLFLVSVVILTVGSLEASFAEAYCNTVSAFLRGALGLITSVFPFSLAETAVILAPFCFIILLAAAVWRQCAGKQKGTLKRFAVRFFCLCLLLLTVFIQTFGICYKRESAADLFELDTASLTERDIYVSAALAMTLAEQNAGSGLYSSDGASHIPYDFNTLKQKVRHGYEKLFDSLPLVFSIKPVALSEPWTYTHISGMYMPLTGESNLNVNYPDYVVAFTACHEVAHQLGIAYESEANFIAFLACMYSQDDYLRYAGALNLFEYLTADLDTESVGRLYRALDGRLVGELRAYSAFFDKYRTSKAAEVSQTFNDGYLKSQGVAAGTKNYSEVSRLAAAYLKKYLPDYFT